MIEKFCNFLVNKMRKSAPEINDERAEVINYGLQLIVGEIPKIFILFGIAYIFGILKYTAIAFLVIQPYRMFSGGFHAKTHIGCIIATITLYCIPAYISSFIVYPSVLIKQIIVLFIWIFGMIMVRLYAPADTENVPILRAKDRRVKKICSYITLTITLTISLFVNNQIISNLLLFGCLLQTIMITKLTYRITNNKYGYEEYIKQNPVKI